MIRAQTTFDSASFSPRRVGHPKSVGQPRSAAAVAGRRASYRMGHAAEWLAALWLMLRGYRILERRFRTRAGEVDLIAVRGQTLAFVEVKYRRSRPDAEAALTPRGARRSAAAADQWIAHRPRYQAHAQRLDALLLTPWAWPRHLPGALDAA